MTQDLADLLIRLDATGVRLWPDGGNIRYKSPAPIDPAVRNKITEAKPQLLAHLAVWNTPAALRLMDAADAAVARNGACGLDPLIQAEAAACVAAHGREDMPVVRAACAKIEARAREIGARGGASRAA